jgi:hypothetical protein
VRIESDGQIVADHDLSAESGSLNGKMIKVIIQLRSTTGDVEVFNGRVLDKYLEAAIDPLFCHHLCPFWPRIHMAMAARLIAFTTDVDLQRDKAGAFQFETVLGQFGFEQVHCNIQLLLS